MYFSPYIAQQPEQIPGHSLKKRKMLDTTSLYGLGKKQLPGHQRATKKMVLTNIQQTSSLGDLVSFREAGLK